MAKRETAKEFILRLKSIPNPDLTKKETICAFGKRLQEAIRPEIEKQDRLQAKSLSRSFTKVVW